ncbi:MAG: SBBP repeat-containing protein [Acidimicrobiales bacterium]
MAASAAGPFTQRRPVAYQDIGGGRRAVSADYVLAGPSEVSLRLGPYDPARTLVIDPVIAYGTYLGGSGDESGHAVAVDTSGNAYVTGSTGSADFPVTAGLDTTGDVNNGDAFVAKLGPTGAIVYATYFGRGGSDEGTGIAVDTSGNAYVVGTSSGVALVTKVGPTGAVVYTTFVAGTVVGDDIAVDTSGSAYVTGSTNKDGLPATPGLDTTYNGGGGDAFVAKVGPNGTIVYATYLGGSETENGRGIAVDTSGHAYVTGFTHSSDFPATPGLDTTYDGGYDAFAVKLGPDGAIVFATYLGSGPIDTGRDIAVDAAGNAYVTGRGSSDSFPYLPGPTAPGGGFVAKLGPTGAIVYAASLPWAEGQGIAVEGSGSAYVTGGTSSSDFPATPGLDTTLGGSSDAFVVKLAPTGAFAYATYLGGSAGEFGFGIAVDASGNPYVTGYTSSADFPPTPGLDNTLGGVSDAFVVKFAEEPSPPACTIDRRGDGPSASHSISGTEGPDVICGSDFAENIVGRGGDDVIFGGDGNDRMIGSDGDDTITGNAGTDSASGGAGTDGCSAERTAACET